MEHRRRQSHLHARPMAYRIIRCHAPSPRRPLFVWARALTNLNTSALGAMGSGAQQKTPSGGYTT